MKRVIGLLLAVFMLLSAVPVMAEEPLKLLLYGDEIAFDVPPQIINGRTMVPLRAIFETLGATVDWEETTRTVVSQKGDITVKLTVDDATMYVDGAAVALDSPACIVNGRILAPVRAVAEAFGISVEWFAEERTVAIGGDDGVYEAPLFHNGFALIANSETGKFGYLNQQGELAIPCQFDYAYEFSCGLARVVVDGKVGYIGTDGYYVVDPRFDWAYDFSEGLALVEVDGKCGYINTLGRYVAEPQFDYAYDFSEGLAVVAVDDGFGYNFGYIGTDGYYVIYPWYDYACAFSEGMAAVEVDGKYGYINTLGRYVAEPQFDLAGPFSEGLAGVAVDGKYGYIGTDGYYVAEPQFDSAGDFKDGIANVLVGDSWGCINQSGYYVVTPQAYSPLFFEEGFAILDIDGKQGFVNKNGEVIAEPQFDSAYSFSEGLAAVMVVGEKWGYINTKGDFVMEPKFDMAESFKNGVARVWENGKWRFIDKNGAYVSEAYADKYHHHLINFDDGYTVYSSEDLEYCMIYDENTLCIYQGELPSVLYDYLLNKGEDACNH